ncbi:MAG TPA: pyridoxal-phosphate dependent enzyme [Eudoraea sp.]|nr:pyridoxal-phosphate dependent enzyme [Eudoraea sp.]
MKAAVTHINLPITQEKQVSLSIKREDLLYPDISGNKFRKLKYNLLKAKEGGYGSLLTFGGAYSNHILATAYAGKAYNFKTIGIIRGEELANRRELNPTLQQARKAGMEFNFISRKDYRAKENDHFLNQLRARYGNCYILPEGGTNALAIKGCEEILNPGDVQYDFICCSVGTGGTLAGLINSSHSRQRILGFPAIKGDFLKKDICKFVQRGNWELFLDYHFGGYAKVSTALISFLNDFKEKTRIPLDPIYTGKMLFGILDRIERGYFTPNSRILAIHTGGLQGIAGMNRKLKEKNLPLIDI